LTIPVVPIKVDGWHRLLSSKHNRRLSPANDIDRLSGSTDDAAQAERRGLIGIGPSELLFGVPHARIVNDAFSRPGLAGARFNDTTRGAWYASEELETSLVEVAYHKIRNLADIVVPGVDRGRPDKEIFLYDDWLADFRMSIHSLDSSENYDEFLQAEPIPHCYRPSQALAHRLINTEKSNGILYPSVRRHHAKCLVCFRPALVHSPRCERRYKVTLEDIGTGYHVVSAEVPLTFSMEPH